MLKRFARSVHMPSAMSFPLAALQPKAETHADKFLEKYPTFDGRGVKVAIFDTGVDPAAVGLQKTTTGLPKILDLIDATGSGDVRLTTIPSEKVQLHAASSLYELEGLSGRSLKVPTSWVKGEGTWQLGLKRLYELWPSDLTSRIQGERKKAFLQKHNQYTAEAQLEYSKFEILQEPTDEQRQTKKDLEAQLQALNTLKDEYKDEGPVYDCIVYKPTTETELDKTAPVNLPWAVVDISEAGDLSDLSPMNAYSHSQQYAVFSEASLMSYSYNFYDDDILSINVVSGTHGTHVAGIVAAHHPENALLDGVAPGAQLISIKIGDTRMGSIETSQSFMRAMNEAIKLGVDVINISYGEDSHIANDGPLMSYMRDKVIRKHKITVVSSAGNNGPGYSTIGAPGGMTSSIISVGAYVSREMAEAQYALRDQAGGSAYTWSSRGPSIDGDKGVTIFAPGAAITCVPPYALNQTQLMNGTSMSSPNAAGGIAMLISGAKADAIAYSPGSLKRAIERSARDVGDEFKVGMLDLPAAFQDLSEGDGITSDLYFDVKINKTKRGIVLRDAVALQDVNLVEVEIKPALQETATKDKFDFEVYTRLECDDKYLEFPEFVHLNYTGRAIVVRVDPTRLSAGLHISSIRGVSDVTNKTLFEIPVTIVKAEPTDSARRTSFDLKFVAGKIERRYIEIPAGVKGCSIQMQSNDITTPIQLWTAITQFEPDTRRTWTSSQFVQNYSYSESADFPTKTVKLIAGPAEFCFAQFWNTMADQPAHVKVSVDFHGIHADWGSVLPVTGGDGFKQILVKSETGAEELKPVVRLEMLRKHLRPSKSVVTALGSRDILEDSTRLYSMVLQYSINFARAGESQFILPMSGTLYENPWYSAFFQVYDDQKNLVYLGSTYPEKHKFEKKTYTIQLQLVHKDRATLEKVKDTLLKVESKLEKEITLDIYDNLLKVWAGPKAEFKNVKLAKGTTKSLVISGATELPKDAAHGDILVGSVTLSKYKELKGQVQYSVPPSAIPKKEDEKPLSTLDLQIEMGGKISDKDDKFAYFADLSKTHPKDLKVLSAHLDNCKEEEKEYIANSIIDLIDAQELARFFGTTQVPVEDQSDAQKEESKTMTRSKTLLAKAYAIKVQHSEGELDGMLVEYNKWTQPDSASSLLTLGKGYLAKKQFGRALVKVQAAQKTGDLKKDEEKEALDVIKKSVEALEWSAWVEKIADDQRGRNPSDFRGF